MKRLDFYRVENTTEAGAKPAAPAVPIVMGVAGAPVAPGNRVYAAWRAFDPPVVLPMTPLRWLAATDRHDALAAFPVTIPAPPGARQVNDGAGA